MPNNPRFASLTKNSHFKKAIRERMAATGENYQKAMKALLPTETDFNEAFTAEQNLNGAQNDLESLARILQRRLQPKHKAVPLEWVRRQLGIGTIVND